MTDRRKTAGDGREAPCGAATQARWTKGARAAFLDTLAETCNVRIACAAAKRASSGAYALRRRDPAFAALWLEALTIGYERLEAALLRHVLTSLNDITIADGASGAAATMAESGTGPKGTGPEGTGPKGTGPEGTGPEETGPGVEPGDTAPAVPLPGTGLAPTRFAPTDVQLAVLLLNRHRATIEGGKPLRRDLRRPTPEETDAALRRAFEGLAKRRGRAREDK